jgi:acetyl esterase/lipase
LHHEAVGLLVAEALVFALAWNALWPRRVPAELGVASFFAGWLTAELSLHILFLNGLFTILFVRAGALADWPGQLGVGLSSASSLLFGISLSASLRSRAVVEVALPASAKPIEWRQILMPLPVTHPDVECLRNVVYHESLKVDIWRKRNDSARDRPALIYIHGGGWIVGHRRYQGLPTLQRMASRGWVCFSVQYRLSPRATFPDHVIDVKRAIAWVRAHADEYGIDASFIVIAGGSAGGHLASLAALTPNHRESQPGFEEADTRVQACISYYGVYDFTNRFGHWPTRGLRMILERWVIKRKFDEARDRYELASPLSHVGPQAPPLLLAHGTRDSVVPIEEARAFAHELRQRSNHPVIYLEIPGGQHAFEIFPSLRTVAVLDGVERFLSQVHEQHRSAPVAG